MNKKKALFTSLAALALASTAGTTFAEEVGATVTEPTTAAESTPAVTENVVVESTASTQVFHELLVEPQADAEPSKLHYTTTFTDDGGNLGGAANGTGSSDMVMVQYTVTNIDTGAQQRSSFDVLRFSSQAAKQGTLSVSSYADGNYRFEYGNNSPIYAKGDEAKNAHFYSGGFDFTVLNGQYVPTPVSDATTETLPAEPVATTETTPTEAVVEEAPVATNTGEETTTPAVSDTTSTVETTPAESVTEEVATQPVVKEPVSVETSKTEPAVEDASVAQTPSIPTTEQPTSETVKVPVLDKTDSAPTPAVVEPQPTTKVVASKTPTPTAKKEGSAVTPAPSSQAFAGQQAETVASKPTYSRVEAAKQAEATQTGLPNTGDVTSLLGVIGAGLSALGLTGLRRRHK